MPSASNAKLEIESGQTLVDYTALTDSGDHKKHTHGSATLWSNRDNYTPTIRPNGIVSGGVTSVAASGSNDVVDITAMTVYLAGVSTSVSASTDESVTRATGTGNTHIINSITVNSGGSIAVVQGAEGTSFSATRGANGGPPWIATGSIEVAQVKLSSQAAAAVTAAEIFQVSNTHREMYNDPLWDTYPIGDQDNTSAYVNFLSALPQIHSDDSGSTTAGKKVYAQVYTITFSELPRIADFVPPENSYSTSSTQVYSGTVGSTSTSLGAGSFNANLQDGVTDTVVSLKGEKLAFRFYPNRYTSSYMLCQGILGISRTLPAGASMVAACTIAAGSVVIDRAA